VTHFDKQPPDEVTNENPLFYSSCIDVGWRK